MAGESEFGKCDICKQNKPLERTYYHYDIKCDCHSPQHFELVSHCLQCRPQEPLVTTIALQTKDLKLEENILLHKNISEYLRSRITGGLYGLTIGDETFVDGIIKAITVSLKKEKWQAPPKEENDDDFYNSIT